MFASLPLEFLDSLRHSVELQRFGKGDVICRQGDLADSFYLIRTGFIKVTEAHPGGDLVLAYLGKGGYFGEIGLLTPTDAAPPPALLSIMSEVVRNRRGRISSA